VITNAVLSVFYGFVGWAASLLPSGSPPDFIDQMSSALGTLIGSAQGLSAWVPWPFVIGTTVVVGSVWLAVLAVKGIRWLLAWIPTWGGS